MRHFIASLLWFAGIAGCSQAPDEPLSLSRSQSESSELKTYVHPFSRSRFAIGTTTTTKVVAGVDEVIGEWGVFGTNQKTGMVLALPNADSPSRLRPALPGGAEAHNKAVEDYFVGAGLPAGEIEAVNVNTKMSASGAGIDQPSQWKFESYTSKISRQYHGVPVVDSYAWAQFNDQGEVVSESVHWPEIPKSVLVSATAFKQALENANTDYFGKVPVGGRLVIHHTGGTWQGPFEANVSYDVAAFGVTRHYDQNGEQFALVSEQ